jgi:hypothetical protein
MPWPEMIAISRRAGMSRRPELHEYRWKLGFLRTLTLYAARIAAALLPLPSVPTLTISPSAPSCVDASKPGVTGASVSAAD